MKTSIATTIKKTALAIIFCLLVLNTSASPANAAGWKTYTYDEVRAGVLGAQSTINSIVDSSAGVDQRQFVRIKEAKKGTDYQIEDYHLKSEKWFWIHITVTNNNDDSEATALGTGVSIKLNSKYSKESTVSTTIYSDNAEPEQCTDTIKVISDKKFKLKYVKGSAFLYNPANNYGRDYNINLDDEIMTGDGALVGTTEDDGYIDPGESATLSIMVEVVQPGERIESFEDLDARTIPKNISLKDVPKNTNEYSTIKAWNLIQKYSNPSVILKQEKKYFARSKGSWTKKQIKKDKKYRYLQRQARKIASGKDTDYKKIYAIAKATAGRVYYDWPYYEGKKKTTNMHPYAIWTKKRAVCAGYATLNECLLNSIGIPTMVIEGDGHAYNASYSRAKKRWIIYDSTWMSGNNYYGKSAWEKGSVSIDRFDMPPEQLSKIGSHQIYSIEGIKRGNTVYRILTGKDPQSNDAFSAKYTRTSSWFIYPSAQVKKSKHLVIHKKVAGYTVKKIQKFSFFNKRHIRKVTIPTTVNKIGNHAFYVNFKKRRLNTTVKTKLPRSKLNMKNGWWNRNVRVVR